MRMVGHSCMGVSLCICRIHFMDFIVYMGIEIFAAARGW